MIDIVTYRGRKYGFYTLIGVLLWFLGFSLQSCSVATNKLGVNYISRGDLDQDRRKYEKGVFPIELRNSIRRLIEEGFVGDNAVAVNDHVNVKKHLMFVFYHCLKFSQLNTPMQDRITWFQDDQAAQGLMYQPVPVMENGQIVSIKFMLRYLFTNNDPNGLGNVNEIREGIAPKVDLRNECLLAMNNNLVDFQGPGNLERVDVDHLLKDNTVTIEIPLPVHRLKTKLLDKLISSLGTDVTRGSQRYWKERLQNI